MSETDIAVSATPDRATRIGNVLVALAFTIVAAVFLYVSATTLKLTDKFGPGPGFIPVCASLGALLGCCYLIVQTLRGVYDESGDAVLHRPAPTLAFIALLLVTTGLVGVVGLVGSLTIFMLGVFIFVEGAAPWRAALVSIGIGAFVYLLLVKLLGVPMPPSLLNL